MKHSQHPFLLGLFLLLLAFTATTAGATTSDDEVKVSLMRVPDGGIQPQSVVDNKSVLHLIYYKGDAAVGDIFYVRRAPNDRGFSAPVRVNSQPGSAIAIGNVRGAHIAVSRGGRVHVSWMGAKGAMPRGPSDATPMLYARMNDAMTAFEPQRNVMQFATGLDGGGSVAADSSGNVYVAWHADAGTKQEEQRRVWVARSSDDGKTFMRETPASDGALGACGCCGMRAFADKDGTLYILYRSATGGVDRDIYLLTSKDRGVSFRSTQVHQWRVESCPMSTAAFGQGGDNSVMAAWETKGEVYFTKVDSVSLKPSQPIPAPGETLKRRHPAIARNNRGETLLIWTEGMIWKSGGALAWQVYDRDGKPTGEKGRIDGVPAWSLITTYARSDGGFSIVY
jgi:hypothetical protein